MTTVLRLGDPARHFWITRGVARAMGVRLGDAMADGRLSAEGYARLVTRCRTCPHVADCERWLAYHPGPTGAAPDNCCNADVLESLLTPDDPVA